VRNKILLTPGFGPVQSRNREKAVSNGFTRNEAAETVPVSDLRFHPAEAGR
jgi:hypothetical protein